MGNLGNPWSIASCHFSKYGPSCKSCRYSIKVFSENMGHPEVIKIVINEGCPKLLGIYSSQVLGRGVFWRLSGMFEWSCAIFFISFVNYHCFINGFDEIINGCLINWPWFCLFDISLNVTILVLTMIKV